MKIIIESPNLDKYYKLFIETGWNELLQLSKNEIQSAIDNSYICICVCNNSELIGFWRLITDKVMYATIYDLIVKPKYQKQGIGSQIVKKLVNICMQLNIRYIQLFAAQNSAPFYGKLGFTARPTDSPGMVIKNIA